MTMTREDKVLAKFARARVMKINADYHRALAAKSMADRDEARAPYEAELAAYCDRQAMTALEDIAALALIDPNEL